MKILFITNSKAEGIELILERLLKTGDTVEVITSKEELLSYLKIDFDIVISDRTNFIIPGIFLDSKRLCINTHPSLLPKHPGSYPVFWTALNGERAGISIHLMDEGIDTGPIIYQKEVFYSEDETFRALHTRTRYKIVDGLEVVLDKIRAGLSVSTEIVKNIQLHGSAHKKFEAELMISKLDNGWDTPISEARNILQKN